MQLWISAIAVEFDVGADVNGLFWNELVEIGGRW